MTYVEIPLDSSTGAALEEQVGIPKECWGHANTGGWRGKEVAEEKKINKNKPLPRNWTAETYSTANNFKERRILEKNACVGSYIILSLFSPQMFALCMLPPVSWVAIHRTKIAVLNLGCMENNQGKRP